NGLCARSAGAVARTVSARRVFVKAATSSNTKTRIRSSEKSLKRNSRNREEKVGCAQAKENHPENLTPRYNLSKSARQTLGQIEPRGSQGVTEKGNDHSHPRVPRSPVVEPMLQCCLV